MTSVKLMAAIETQVDLVNIVKHKLQDHHLWELLELVWDELEFKGLKGDWESFYHDKKITDVKE